MAPSAAQGRYHLGVTKSRLEAFSDGVIAILITIMVLELRPPHGASFVALRPLLPQLLSYTLSFVFLAIYWNNHHHLLQAARHVDGGILWANTHLLFWLSLVPFTTAWMGENGLSSVPVALYGIVLLAAAIAYFILARTLVRRHGEDSPIARALGEDWKGKLSVLLYMAAVGLAFVEPFAACVVYVVVAAIWLVPDRRIEQTLTGGRA